MRRAVPVTEIAEYGVRGRVGTDSFLRPLVTHNLDISVFSPEVESEAVVRVPKAINGSVAREVSNKLGN